VPWFDDDDDDDDEKLMSLFVHRLMAMEREESLADSFFFWISFFAHKREKWLGILSVVMFDYL
jgi:hypothetical protein